VSSGGGTKLSCWLIFRRRLPLVRTLLHGEDRHDALVAAVKEELCGEEYVGDIASAFKHEYACRIIYDRASKRYVLDDLSELALLDLPDTCLEVLAFLEPGFPEGAALPEHASIHELLDRVTLLLPAARRDQQRSQRGVPTCLVRHLCYTSGNEAYPKYILLCGGLDERARRPASS
jgi:hypothetical protein